MTQKSDDISGLAFVGMARGGFGSPVASLVLGGGQGITMASYDPDAQAYANAVRDAKGSAVTAPQIEAINSFVLSEKEALRWSKHKRIFLPIWANAGANAIDLKSLATGSFSGAFTHSNGKSVAPASGYFNFGASISGLGLTNATKVTKWYLQVDSDTDSYTCPMYSYSTGASEIGFRNVTSLNIYSMAEIYQTMAAPLAYRSGIYLASYAAGNQYSKLLQGSTLSTLNDTATASAIIPPTVNHYAFNGNQDGSLHANSVTGGLGAYGLSEGMTKTDANAFMQNLKTLWVTCTGLSFPS